MKFQLLFVALLAAFSAPAQALERDTIFGVAMVIDTTQEWDAVVVGNTISSVPTNVLTPAIWPSYSITEFYFVTEGNGNSRPRVKNVRYYHFDKCFEIPFNRLLVFKQQ
jgi:hypothetical protein